MLKYLLQRAGAPLTVLALLIIVSAAVAKSQATDVSTAGQNRRLSFEVGGQMGRLTPLAGVSGQRPMTLALLRELPARRAGLTSVLVIGNSQTMAIMDRRPEDRLSSAWLATTLNGWDRDEPFAVRLASEANLTMSELLIKLAVATGDAARRPDAVVVGIVLDGLRWVEARADLVALVDSDGVRGAITRALDGPPRLVAAGRAMEEVLRTRQPVAAGGEARPARLAAGWPIAGVERALNRQAEAYVPLFAERRNIQAKLRLRYTSVRNAVFGFKTTTRRPIAPAMYTANLELIEGVMRLLREQGVRVVFYIAPIRPLEPNPYHPEDVARFRRGLAGLCQRYGLPCLDYSGLVPEALWTDYPEQDASGVGGQPDFAHFTGAAHRLLGERLARDIRPWLEPRAAARR